MTHAEFHNAIEQSMLEQVKDYEAQHGPVEPLPRSTRIPRRPDEKMVIAFFKGALIEVGALPKPESR